MAAVRRHVPAPRALACAAHLCAWAALLAGCPTPGGERCNVDDDCSRREVCTGGYCVAFAAGPDAGAGVDAGAADAGAIDAGPGDAGADVDVDAGVDAGDEGASDGGEPDAGEVPGDAGASDAGPGDVDAGTNAPPVIDAVGAVRLRAGTVVDLAVTAHDPDGDAVHFTVTRQGAIVTASGGASPSVSAPAGATGGDDFELAPVDERGLAGDPVTVAVQVLPADWLDVGAADRRRIDVEPPSIATSVADVPVRVDLGPALGSFVDEARGAVRFFDGDGAVLPAELDSDGGSTLVFWVRRDVVAGSDSFFVYAGGTPVTAAPSSTEVWRGYDAVYHMNPGFADATGNHAPLAPTSSVVTSAGLIGACADLDGASGALHIGDSLLDVSAVSAATLSASATLHAKATDQIGLVSYSLPSGGISSRVAIGLSNGPTQPRLIVRADDGDDAGFTAPITLPVATALALTGVFDATGGLARMFVDGVLVDGSTYPPQPAFPATPSQTAEIGAEDDGSGGFFDGCIDEVRVRQAAESADFIAVDASSRAGTLATVDPTPF